MSEVLALSDKRTAFALYLNLNRMRPTLPFTTLSGLFSLIQPAYNLDLYAEPISANDSSVCNLLGEQRA